MNAQRRRPERSQASRGTSLMEVAVSTMLTGVMLVATLDAVGAVFRTRGVLRQRHQAHALAQDLMSEIVQTCYEDPDGSPVFGPEMGEGTTSRADWDDLDDYHALSESPPADMADTPLPNAAGWRREVQIEPVQVASPDSISLAETGLRRITVHVHAPGGAVTTLRCWRSRWGALEMRPPISTTYVTGVKAEVQIGEGSTATSGGTVILNTAEGT